MKSLDTSKSLRYQSHMRSNFVNISKETWQCCSNLANVCTSLRQSFSEISFLAFRSLQAPPLWPAVGSRLVVLRAGCDVAVVGMFTSGVRLTLLLNMNYYNWLSLELTSFLVFWKVYINIAEV